MDAVIDAARGVGTVGLASLVTWLGIRQTGKKQKTDVAQSLIDQLQEERTEIRNELAKVRADQAIALKTANERVEKIEGDIRAAYRREMDRDDFIQELRNHIRLGLGPPPPEWPESLRHG